jgi:hypothetical protein
MPCHACQRAPCAYSSLRLGAPCSLLLRTAATAALAAPLLAGELAGAQLPPWADTLASLCLPPLALALALAATLWAVPLLHLALQCGPAPVHPALHLALLAGVTLALALASPAARWLLGPVAFFAADGLLLAGLGALHSPSLPCLRSSLYLC